MTKQSQTDNLSWQEILDTTQDLARLTLDAIREDNVKDAESLFKRRKKLVKDAVQLASQHEIDSAAKEIGELADEYVKILNLCDPSIKEYKVLHWHYRLLESDFKEMSKETMNRVRRNDIL